MALGEQVVVAKDAQVVADPALGQGERPREFSNRQLLALEEAQNTQADRIAQGPQEGRGGEAPGFIGLEHSITLD